MVERISSYTEGASALFLEEDSDDAQRGVAHGAEYVAVAGEVGSGRRTSNVHGKSVGRIRGITVTGRSTIDGRDGGLGRGAIRAKGHGRELGEARDTVDTEVVELEEAVFV